MTTFREIKEISIREGINPEDVVVIHKGPSDYHRDAESCWCKPLVITGQEFMASSFDF